MASGTGSGSGSGPGSGVVNRFNIGVGLAPKCGVRGAEVDSGEGSNKESEEEYGT